MRAVARQFTVSLDTVQRWVHRAADQRLDRVEWENRPDGCRPAANRVARDTEDWVVRLRRDLQERSPLGEYGAAAIHRVLGEHGSAPVPSVRTIGRVLERRGALDGRRLRVVHLRCRTCARQPDLYAFVGADATSRTSAN